MAEARLAQASDLPGMISLYRELHSFDQSLQVEPLRDKWLQLLAEPTVRVSVVEADGVLAATCMLGIIPTITRNARPFGIIEHVVTAEAFRRRGFGRMVIDHALNVAWTLDCYKVMLLSGMQRDDAHRMYENIGFVGDREKGFVVKPEWHAEHRR